MTEEKPKPRRMKPGGGKAKGNGFESAVAKKLSEALAPLKFIRTPGSGARVGGKNFEALGKLFGDEALKLFVGDVVPVNEKEAGVRFKFSIECKFYRSPDKFTALMAGTANVFKWVREAIDDARKTGRTPLLVFKWNNTPIYAATLHGDARATAKITLVQNDLSVDIFYLDDLLTIKEFWQQ